MTFFPRGFAETFAIAQWTRSLGGVQSVIEAQSLGVAEVRLGLSQASRVSSPHFVMPSVLSHEQAPEYFGEITGQSMEAMGWLMFVGIGTCRVIARHLDLLSALHFISEAPLDREYAIEREEGDGYRLISGYDTGVSTLSGALIHTHRNRIALPSEADLNHYEEMAVNSSQNWFAIYSRPRRGVQLCFVERVEPLVFGVRFFRDWRDTNKGERRSEMRSYEIRMKPDKYPGLPKGAEEIRVVEQFLGGGECGPWIYDERFFPDNNIQNFWKMVLDRAPQKPLARSSENDI